MSTSLSFEDDAFISYGHIDNSHLEDEGRGWVDNLHERLEYRLGELLGYRPRVWRDPRLPGNVYFAAELEDRLGKTCVLVAVLSPGYLQSAWCMGELREFCRVAQERGGLQVAGGRLRVFKVVKTHVERDQHPAEFQGQLGYEFYELDRQTGRPVEYGQGLGKNRDQRYWDKLNDLAWDIKQTLSAVKPAQGPAAPATFPSGSKGAVYVAETSYDLRDERDRIKRELQERGFRVLPDRELPYMSPDYQEAVREAVGRSKLSVHLVGARYGIVPDGAAGSSDVRLQNEVAAERSGDPAFKRLIWLPERLEPLEATQASFIQYLKTSADPQRGAELLQTTLEELKSVIESRLSTNGHRPAQAADGAASAQKKIYLICDRRDVEGVAPLCDLLFERGYEVLLPLLDDVGGDAQAVEAHNAAAVELHKENLKTCDAALIYYGNANQSWVDFKRRDLEKAAAYGREHPLLARAVYVAGPQTPHKMLFRTHDALVLKNPGGFKAESLTPFLDLLGGAGAEGGER
jgi:hypothetical protein